MEDRYQNAANRCRSNSATHQATQGTACELETPMEAWVMSDDDFELVRGSGNVFRDLGEANAEVLQLKAILAGKIVEVLDEQGISVRQAHELTGFAAADFSRVRQA